MHFLEPWGLLGLAALAPVIALYFLKLKREPRVVPSTLLWKKVLEDLQVNAPFQRLRYSLLLLLQLVLLALLGFALARPFLPLPGVEGQRTVLLVDTSASMATRDAGPDGQQTRLAAAVEAAKAKVDELGRNGEMRVVAFDEEVRQFGSFSQDRVFLRDQLARLAPRDLRTRAQPAFETALALAEDPGTEIVVLSDFAFGRLDLDRLLDAGLTPPAPGGAAGPVVNVEDAEKKKSEGRSLARLRKFHFVPFGSASDNAGITAISARTSPVRGTNEKGEKVTSLETQVLVQVENFSDKDLTVLLRLSAAGQNFAPRPVALKRRPSAAPGQEPPAPEALAACREQVVLKLPSDTLGVVTARLELHKDAFPLDDQAWVAVGSSEGLKVLLVSSGSYFLEKALAVMRGTETARLTPEEFRKQWQEKGPRATADYDAVLFDGLAPPEWREGGAVFLNALPPLEGFRDLDRPLEGPTIVDWDISHPALRYVNFNTIEIAKARTWVLPKGARTLVEGPAGAPLVASFETARLRVVGVAFDLYESSWAYRAALPLFVRHAVSWVSEVSPRRRPTAQHTGEPLPLPPLAGAPTAQLTFPDGHAADVQLSADRKTYFADTQTMGVYTLSGLPAGPDGKPDERFFAVNLADVQESDNAVRAVVEIGDEKVETSRAMFSARAEAWHWLAAVAAVILLAEWWIYHRRLGL